MGGDLSKNLAASKEMQKYFKELQKEIDNCYKIANQARKKGLDPEKKVEIPQALDLAKRVEELVGPKEIAKEIRKKTQEIKNRELVSLEIAKQIAKNKEKYKFKNKEQALDQAVRTGLAILTEGVLVAPLEGIADVKLGKNNDGTEYVDLYFSGPIRSAGGTGQAMSVLIADIVRREMNIGPYKPTKGEIERYKEEIPLYKRAQHLQYTPTVDEIEKIVSNCPICINGEGTEKEEVTGYRDLPRIETNRLRGGACLVIAEGLCLKSPKIIKHVKKLRLRGWEFLDIFAQKKEDEEKDEKTKKIPEIKPSKKYIGEVIAGRPVFSHPSRKGGFRLRYGRARTAGLASTAINPASMHILDEFIAIGTQLKTERPGKGTIGTPCTEIEGPIVLLTNGDLVQYNNKDKIEKTKIKSIIDLGEILIPYGEFLENNSLLPKSSYVKEWWIQELYEKLKNLPKKNTIEQIKKSNKDTKERLKQEFKKEIDLDNPSFSEAVEISKKYDIALHPNYNLFWHDLSVDEIKKLRNYILDNGEIKDNKLKIKLNQEIKEILITLGALHVQRKESLIFDKYSDALIFCLGLEKKEGKIIKRTNLKETKNPIKLLSHLSDIKIKERSPFRIGTRMGRPEKAAERKMRPPPHVLFPVGNYGGNQRLLGNAAEKSKIEIEAGTRICPKCKKKTFKLVCSCGTHTEIKNGRIEIFDLHLFKELENAKKKITERTLPDTIKGVIGTISKNKTPEPLEKGILRAKHNVYVFKDGTIRFDMTDAPLTHFKPKEIGVTVDRLKELGYTHDYLGDEITSSDQIIELKVQDIIISKSCAEYFTQVANFIDDLLVKYYGQKRFYNIKKLEQLTGHLTVGLAPHTSAGSLSRIIGFTNAQVSFAHPYYHAAKRRNCLSSDTTIVISNSDNSNIIKLSQLYENTSSEEKIVDDFGTKQKSIRGISTYSINKTKGCFEKNLIQSIIKSKAPNFVQKITLKSGRSFIASPYHRLNVLSDGKITTKKVVELNNDDKFFTSKKLDLKVKDIEEFDLLELFFNSTNSHIVVRGIREFVERCIIKIGGLKKTSKLLNLNKKTFSNYIYRDSIPINILIKLIKFSGEKFSDIPKECNLGVKRNNSLVPRLIRVDDSLLRLLGYYLSEGHSRCSKKSNYQVGFACTEKEIIDDITNCISNSFKLSSYKSKSGIFICNRIIHDFFVDVLKAGKNAKLKKIPNHFINLPKEKIKELLKAYFSGDGSVEKNRLHISCSSVSNSLLRDIGLQLLRFGIFYRLKSETRKPTGIVKSFYDKKEENRIFTLNYISIRSSYAKIFYEKIGFTLSRKNNALKSVLHKERKPRIELFGDFVLDPIKNISIIISREDYVYDLEVQNSHNFLINDFLITNNCDGDEDGQMLLMDALLNFSHSYIPDKRGGKMDLPLILTTRLDPSEVDKEAHNVDTLFRYPLEFYRATETHEHSKELEKQMDLVSSRLGTELQYEHFGFTHDTNDISEGPKMSNYKTLKTMMDKMNAQLNLAAKIRAVDESDVAYKVIERHFLPDILGNLRAFSKQSVRCPTCNITYRRPPLKGVCHKCGGKLTLTVHEKSVKKYLEISKDVAKRYNISPYACQRIKLVEKSIDSLFMSDKIKTTKLDDFF